VEQVWAARGEGGGEPCRDVPLHVIFKVIGLFVGHALRYSSVNNSALHVWRERRVVISPNFVSGELLERNFFVCKEW
jgi:hypothetical protein